MPTESIIDFNTPLHAKEENLEIEFKEYLALEEKSSQSKLAKEICALANCGGGWIVIGRSDDGTYPKEGPSAIIGASQDTINQISSTYLVPPPHCTARWIKVEEANYQVLVIYVPSIDISPICGKKNGPQDHNGKTIGIKKGVYYIRKAGPTSEPISTPDEWQVLIRRCVLNDRESLLSALSTMIRSPTELDQIEDSVSLDSAVEAFLKKWVDVAKEEDLTVNHICFAFDLIDLKSKGLEVLGEAIHKVSSSLSYGAHRFFDNSYPSPADSYSFEVGGVDGLEVFATQDKFDQKFAWRMSEDLVGIEIFTYWEDTNWIKNIAEGRGIEWVKGKSFWMCIHAGMMYDFLSYVRRMSDHFQYDGKIELYLLYSGVSGRSLNSINPYNYYSMRYTARQDKKNIRIFIDRSDLNEDVLNGVIVNLLHDVNKLFQGPAITAQSISKCLKSLL